MLVLPLTRAWLISRAAQRIYFCAALLALALSGTLIGLETGVVAAGSSLPGSAAQLFRYVLLVELTGAALLWVAMLYFWINFDQPADGKRSIWFVVLFFGTPLGWALYYFFVYRRRVRAFNIA